MDLLSYMIGRKGGVGIDVPSTIMGMKSGGGSVEIVPWSTGTDEQIVAMIDAAHNGDIDLQTDGGWKVGDTRTVTISAISGQPQQEMDLVISQFGDYMSCGSVMQFDFKDCLSNLYDCGNSLYGDSNIKKNIMPALANALPQGLSSRLLTFDVICSSTYCAGDLIVSGNKLAVRSASEIYGTPTGLDYGASNYHDGTQVAYYVSNKTKKTGKGGSGTTSYLMRTKGDNNAFTSTSGGKYVYSTGGIWIAVSAFGCL